MVGLLGQLKSVAAGGMRYRTYFADAVEAFRLGEYDDAADALVLAKRCERSRLDVTQGAATMALAIVEGAWDGAYFRLGSTMLRREDSNYVVSTTYFVGAYRKHCDQWRGEDFELAVRNFGALVLADINETRRVALGLAAYSLAYAVGTTITLQRAS
jgi:hypothetical protein